MPSTPLPMKLLTAASDNQQQQEELIQNIDLSRQIRDLQIILEQEQAHVFELVSERETIGSRLERALLWIGDLERICAEHFTDSASS